MPDARIKTPAARPGNGVAQGSDHRDYRRRPSGPCRICRSFPAPAGLVRSRPARAALIHKRQRSGPCGKWARRPRRRIDVRRERS